MESGKSNSPQVLPQNRAMLDDLPPVEEQAPMRMSLIVEICDLNR
jgi:hypothetical protein